MSLCNNLLRFLSFGMEKADIRKIKTVQGRKVVHPYQFGTILFSFFLLLLIAFPVGLFFVPLMIFPDMGTQLSGLELFKYYAIDFWIEPPVDMPAGVVSLLYFAKDELWVSIYSYILLGQAAIIAILFIVSIAALISFIVSLSKGYLRHPGGIKALAVLDFIFSLLFSLSFFFFYIMAMIGGNAQYMIPWFSFIPAGASLVVLIIISIAYTVIYSDCLYEDELEFHEDDKDEVVTSHVMEVHEVTKETVEHATTIPNNITQIGGHEFAYNQHIQVANIPIGISSLGANAFANCANLRVVSMPMSVKSIGERCFFNCSSLVRINYAGTKQEWRHVRRGKDWLANSKTTEVVCVDGPIIVNPYR